MPLLVINKQELLEVLFVSLLSRDSIRTEGKQKTQHKTIMKASTVSKTQLTSPSIHTLAHLNLSLHHRPVVLKSGHTLALNIIPVAGSFYLILLEAPQVTVLICSQD